MTEPSAGVPGWDDVLALITQLDAGDYADVDLTMPGLRLRMSRTGLPSDGSATPTDEGPGRPAAPTPAPSPAPAPAAPRPVEAPAPTAVVAVAGTVVTAPMLGVFYGRPSPDAAPFVTVGDTVDVDTTVAIVEVMKLMNQVTAGVAGTVVEVCAADGELVEFGQLLLRIEETRS